MCTCCCRRCPLRWIFQHVVSSHAAADNIVFACIILFTKSCPNYVVYTSMFWVYIGTGQSVYLFIYLYISTWWSTIRVSHLCVLCVLFILLDIFCLCCYFLCFCQCIILCSDGDVNVMCIFISSVVIRFRVGMSACYEPLNLTLVLSQKSGTESGLFNDTS